MSEAMRSEVSLETLFKENPERLIVIHRDLFQDHSLLLVEVLRTERRAKDVGQDVE